MLIAAVLFAPLFTLAMVAGVRVVEAFGDRLAAIGPLSTRPTLVRLLLMVVVTVAGTAMVMWVRRTTLGRRWRTAWRQREPASASRSGSGSTPRLPSPAGVAAFVATVATSIVIVHWPNLTQLSTHFLGFGDSEQHIGLAQLLREEMSLANPIPGKLTGIVHPDGLDSLLLDGYGPIWVTAVLGFVFGPVLAYNLALVLTTAANATAGWVLGRRFTAHFGVLALGALAFATAPNVAVRAFAGHMNLTWLFTVAFIAAEALRDGRQSPSVRRLAPLFALAYLGSGYFLVIGGLIAAGIYLSSRPVSSQRTIVRFLLAGLVAAVLLAPWLVSRTQFTADESEGPAAEVIDDALRSARRFFVADTTSLMAAVPGERFVTVPFSDTRRGDLQVTVEGWSNPGWVLLAALGAVLVVAGTTRLVVGAGTVFLFVLALGPVPRVFRSQYLVGPTDMGWMPYTLFDVAPVLGGLRVPGRFSMGLAVLAVMALAASGEWVQRRMGRRAFGVVCGALVLVVVATNARDIGSFQDFAADADVVALAEVDDRAEPGDAALVIPNDCLGLEVRYTMLAIHTDVPIAGCHAPHLTLRLASGLDHYLDDSMRSFRCVPEVFAFVNQGLEAPTSSPTREMVDALSEDLGIRFLFVHLPALAAPGCEDVRARVEQTVAGGIANPVGTAEQFLILDLAS
jgi:hypothetical protein